MDDRLREIEPGWIVLHRNAHEAVVKEVRDGGVLVRHDSRRDGPHVEFIPWDHVTSARPGDRFNEVIDHLRNIGAGHWSTANPSVAEVIANDARYLVVQLAEESGAKLRLTEERDQALNALREAREENEKLRRERLEIDERVDALYAMMKRIEEAWPEVMEPHHA